MNDMLTQYKEVTKALEVFMDGAQPLLDAMLEQLKILEAEEKTTKNINVNYSNMLLRQIITESDRVKERQFKLGFTLTEIRFTAVMVEGRRPGEVTTHGNIKERPVTKAVNMLSGLSKEDIKELLKDLK